MRPGDGMATMRWARCTAIVGPGGRAAVVDAPGAPTNDGAVDSWLLARLRELDRRFVGWLPGFLMAAGPELERAQEMLARRRSYRPPWVAWPTLPGSVVRRARICRELAPARVYVEDDVDGLAVLLGDQAQVTVAEPDPAWRAWLAAEAERGGGAVVVADDPVVDGSCDVAVIHAGAPAHTRAAIARGVAATRAGGHLVVCLRSPWHAGFWTHVEAAGLQVRAHHREVDHPLVPPDFVVDGAGDVVVLERPEPAGEPPCEGGAETLRAQPYLLLDVDGLAPDRLDDGALGRFADLVGRTGPRAEATRFGVAQGGVELLRWCDEGGAGLTCELHRDDARLRVLFLPYDDALARAVVHAALHTLADAATRLRPPRTLHGSAPAPASSPGLAAAPGPAGQPAAMARPALARAAGDVCHLADGIILVVDGAARTLVDVRVGEKTRLDADVPLDAASAGTPLEPSLGPWLDRGVLARGPAGVDPVVRAGLAALDLPHLAAFARHLDARARDAYEAVLSAHAHRKRLVATWSQCPVLPETALRRALLVGDARRVGPKRVVCVGDGDLVSVALAALGHEVTVLDLDDDLLALLRRVTAALGLTVAVQRRDFLEPLPAQLRGAFDLFLTDPVSSRECFEVFGSRAVDLVGTGGRGWVAVSARASRAFASLARGWGLDVVAWHARHNRYFAPTLRPHAYESDWVEVAKTSATTVRWPAGEPARPRDLYRDGLEREPTVLLSFFDAIEGGEHTRGLFLDMLLDVAERQGGMPAGERHRHGTADWSMIFGAAAEGHVTVHVDRARRQLLVALSPLEPRVADVLHRIIAGGHKSQARAGQVSTGDGFCDLRML